MIFFFRFYLDAPTETSWPVLPTGFSNFHAKMSRGHFIFFTSPTSGEMKRRADADVCWVPLMYSKAKMSQKWIISEQHKEDSAVASKVWESVFFFFCSAPKARLWPCNGEVHLHTRSDLKKSYKLQSLSSSQQSVVFCRWWRYTTATFPSIPRL